MSLNKMKIIVTGAGGFIGKHLCSYLSVKHDVDAVYSKPKRINQRKDKFPTEAEYNSSDILISYMSPWIIPK